MCLFFFFLSVVESRVRRQRPGVAHAPGPWPTLEVQLPQDDFNMLATRPGVRLASDAEREKAMQEFMLKGLADAADVVNQAVDMEASCCRDFSARYRRDPVKIQEFVDRIFFDEFDGISVSLPKGASTELVDPRPAVLLVWQGSGWLNGHAFSTKPEESEGLLVKNGPPKRFVAGEDGFLLYILFPIVESKE